jgi:hypothetical protein
LLQSYGLNIKIDAPTRFSNHSESCLDNFITNLTNVKCSVILPTVSDHCAISLEMSVSSLYNFCNFVEFRDMSIQNLNEFRIRLGWEKWTDVYEAPNVDLMYDNFVCTVSHCLDVSCPIKRKKKNVKQKPKSFWVSDEIKSMQSRVKNSYYLEWIDTRCDRKKLEYNELKKA